MADERAPCSVVLEGGVTSAVIYTTLLARLSRDYTFRDLGGASSGAVAAAAAAAAEFACQKAPGATRPFDLLGRFPDELAEVDDRDAPVLLRLFQPKPGGAPVLSVALAALDRRASTAGRRPPDAWSSH